jgi:hypothetical protein
VDRDEDTLRVPASWGEHLDDRPGGRLSLGEADRVLDDPYAYGPSDWRQVARDRRDAAYTFVAELGADALPRLEEIAPLAGWMDAAEQRAAGEAMSVIPTDAAFEALLARATQSLLVDRRSDDAARNERCFGDALGAAMTRFPVRASRTLASWATSRGRVAARCRRLLTTVARRDPDAVREARDALDGAARRVADEVLAEVEVPRAAPEDLPEILREPPWTRRSRKKRRPRPKIPLEPLALEPVVRWRGDERERWAVGRGTMPEHFRALKGEAMWTRAGERYLAEDAPEMGALLLAAPVALARRLAPRWRPRSTRRLELRLGAILERLELDALPLGAWLAEQAPKHGVRLLAPFGAVELAPIMGEALRRSTTREDARIWLRRHPDHAAAGLIPLALGDDAKRAKAAEEALASLVRAGLGEAVREVAARYGDEVGAALEPVLDSDPLEDFPSRRPKMPPWWDPEALPPPELRGGAGALPTDAVEHFGTMLAFSTPGAVYEGVRIAKRACTPESVARFSWALFEAWLEAGAPTKDKWPMWQLGWLGDDEVAHGLTRLMKDWPRQGAAKRAELGLDVLAEMESDVALVLVNQLAQKARSKSLKKNARAKLERIASMRGLTEDELADRLVPDLGLDEGGAMTLDYGPRRFTVGFDEELKPFVLDESGAPRKSLPKPGKRDDPEKAPAAERAFRDLKKNVRTIGRMQIRRFEEAMVRQRRWSVGDFERYVVGHPLLVHLARRLVFGVYDGERLLRSFRVAEDRSYADEHDEELALSADEGVGVAHPLELGEESRARWDELFHDYELLQPFAQLEREVYRPAEGQPRAAYLEALLDFEALPGRVVGLESRGWQRGEVLDAGVFCWMERDAGDGRVARLELSPGIFAGMILDSDEQRPIHLTVVRAGAVLTLDDLPAVVFSELVRDVVSLRPR